METPLTGKFCWEIGDPAAPVDIETPLAWLKLAAKSAMLRSPAPPSKKSDQCPQYRYRSLS